MDKFGLPDTDTVEKIIALVLALPGRVLDQVFKTITITGYEPPAEMKLACLLILSIGLLTICFRYRQKLLAWLIGLYALLLTLVSMAQFFIVLVAWLRPPTISVEGGIKVYERIVTEAQETVQGDWRSNDCGVSETREALRCGRQGKPLSAPFNVRLTSANCGSNVENVVLDPSNPNCLLVRERLTGCGYNSVFGIRDCKGRGWLAYDIDTATRSEDLKLVSEQNVKGSFRRGSPMSMVISVPAGIDASRLSFKYALKVGGSDQRSVELTDTKPSTESIRSDIVGNHLLVSLSTTAQDSTGANSVR